MAAPHVYARLEWLSSTGVKRSCAATLASRARGESGGTRLAGSMELRRPECIRSTIARRPARMLSSPRSRGRASVRHSRAVSTPPVRSVHPMDPIGSVDRGWLMWGLSVRWCRGQVRDKHADESPSRRRGPRALVSIPVSPIDATANNQPSRKVKRDRPQSPSRQAGSAARPVVIAESHQRFEFPRPRLDTFGRHPYVHVVSEPDDVAVVVYDDVDDEPRRAPAAVLLAAVLLALVIFVVLLVALLSNGSQSTRDSTSPAIRTVPGRTVGDDRSLAEAYAGKRVLRALKAD